MNHIIILAHGSRREATADILDTLVAKVRTRRPADVIVPAYLQFCEPSLEAAVHTLVVEGATAVKVVPLFLFDGIHVTEDIPGELERLEAAYPGLKLHLTPHLGADDRIVEMIVERIAQ